MAGRTEGQAPGVVSPDLLAAESDGELLKRFVARRDEAAFAALVARHGPMVLAVCRRALGPVPEAEDAFQAVFLILVRKAASLTQPELLANWLFGVAARTARKARTAAARRAHHERQAALVSPTAPQPDPDSDDLRNHLDEELERLPQKYRAPLVLCYLHGLTNEEAARRLGWPAGSISYRLARGRELLRQRLRRRASFAPALFLGMLDGLAPGPLPPELAAQTVQSALTLARGGVLADAVAAPVRRLVEDGLQSLAPARVGTVSLVVLAILLALLAAGACAAATGNLPWGSLPGARRLGASVRPGPASFGLPEAARAGFAGLEISTFRRLLDCLARPLAPFSSPRSFPRRRPALRAGLAPAHTGPLASASIRRRTCRRWHGHWHCCSGWFIIPRSPTPVRHR
jgi:RNA polymerase sigma factor (sigma-70 family)